MIKNHNKIAVTFKELQYSYSQLLQFSLCYSNFFLKCSTPEKILIYAENSPEWIFAFYGTMRCNAIVIPVDAQSSAKELQYIVNDCTPNIIFTTSDKQSMVNDIVAEAALNTVVVTKNNIDIADVDTLPVIEISDGNDNDTAFIIYTSGTTGSPKGVMLSYKSVYYNINAVSKYVPIFKKSSNVMILLPLHHAFPLMGSLVAPLYTGGSVHIAERMTSNSILQTLNDGKISIVIGVPRLYETLAKGMMLKINGNIFTRCLYRFVKAIGSYKFSRLVFSSVHKKFGGNIEYLVSGGAALSNSTAAIFKALGFYVLNGYGMTETGPMISFTRPGKCRIGYSGDPLPGIEVKIADDGEICVMGDNLMQGYYNRPEETSQIIRDGWLHTGDMGQLNGKGIKITGRIKDIIVPSNGKNINPEELEADILHSSPLIQEVGVCLYKSSLQALIVPQMKKFDDKKDNVNNIIKEEIKKFNSGVAPYKRIKHFHIMTQELPKTRLGKIQHFKLVELIAHQ